MSDRHRPLPTTIIAGFLGSGKTTVIGHLIDQLQARGEQVAYIKNEVGETDLDAKLLQGKNIKTKELLSGCICCTIIGPFHAAIDEIVQTYHPDRLLIEASGTADSAALALTVSTHRGLHRDGVMSVIDVVNFEGYVDLSVTAQNQTKFTDLLIFNKIELVDLARKRAVVGYVRELNTHSPIIEAPHGVVPAKLVFGLDDRELDQQLRQQRDTTGQVHNHASDHDKIDQITAFTLPLNKSVAQPAFASWLSSLPKNIIRAKGIVEVANDAPNTAPTSHHIFNMVGGRADFQPAPDSLSQQAGFAIFIGVQAESVRAEVEASLQKLHL